MTSQLSLPVESDSASTIDWQHTLATHDRWLRTILFARLREADAVNDVMQEVALAAVKQAAPIKDVTKIAPWLYQLAVRQALLYRRKHGRLRKLKENYAQRVQPREEDTRCPDPLGWLLADERKRILRQALAQLHRRDTEILMLKYSENWSYHDIAEKLGISHSAVESRLHRARQRLRTELAQTPLGDENHE